MNKIDRHNYEEYFILYMDNELSSTERSMVEAFVQQHPDLKEELELMQQFKLTPDETIQYINKDELLKTASQLTVNKTNYEECFLLYTDNELTAAQKKQVEFFVSQNPSLVSEFTLLQKAKAIPETIIFPYKASLYKQEKIADRKRRIIPFAWRVAAGILVTAGITTALMISSNKKEDGPPVAKINAGQKTTAPAVSEKKNQPDDKERNIPYQQSLVNHSQNHVMPQVVNNVQKENGVTNNTSVVKNVSVPGNDINPKQKTIVSPDIEQPVIAVTPTQKNNNLPAPEKRITAPDKGQKEDVAYTPAEKENKTPNNSLTIVSVTPKGNDPSDIITDDFVEEEKGNKKSKSRGLFRKIARTFEKRTNIDPTDSDGRLLVAGFAFKTR